MTGADKQRVATRFAAPDPRQLLVFIHQRRQRSRLIAGQHKLTAQALFCHANGLNIHQQAKMAGDAQTPGMRNPVAIDKEQVWFLCELLPCRQQRGRFTKGEKKGIYGMVVATRAT